MSDILKVDGAAFTAVLDVTEMSTLLKSLGDRFANIKAFKQDVKIMLGAIAVKDITRHFEDESGPDGKWTPWSLSYAATINGRLAFRRFKGRTVPIQPWAFELYNIKPPRKPGQILSATGRLKKSIMPFNQGRNMRSGKDYLIMYTAAKVKGFPYAHAHDTGGPKLPQRRFMWLSDKALENMSSDLLAYWLDKGKNL